MPSKLKISMEEMKCRSTENCRLCVIPVTVCMTVVSRGPGQDPNPIVVGAGWTQSKRRPPKSLSKQDRQMVGGQTETQREEATYPEAHTAQVNGRGEVKTQLS